MQNNRERLGALRALPWASMPALVLLIGLMMLGGCGQNPAQPEPTVRAEPQLDPVAAEFAALRFFGHDNCSESSGWVTPLRGGRIPLQWGHPLNRLVVYPGAVDEKVLVRISTCVVAGKTPDDIRLIEFDFQPDGLVFNKPALLILHEKSLERLQLRDTNSDTIKLYWLNPETGQWEIYQEVPVVHGRVVFEIEHFSKFGISN